MEYDYGCEYEFNRSQRWKAAKFLGAAALLAAISAYAFDAGGIRERYPAYNILKALHAILD